jgi:glyoxylase-like metal-dependent hydrolase (beta-lactamase superfamily II)
MRTLAINSETTVFTSVVPAPGIGVLPINAFLIKGRQPVLVDTGIFPEHDEFIEALGSVIDPKDIAWIWITHGDRDHTGAMTTMLELAPQARVAASFMTVGILSAGSEPIPMERAHLVRDGSTLELSDRTLVAFRPPTYDNPGTLGLYDPTQKLTISSDCFGGVLPTPDDALAEDIASVVEDDVTAGMLLWGSADSPWVHSIDETKFASSLSAFAAHGDMATVLSTHLPPIRGNVDRHIKTLSMLPSAAPFVGPDQAALEALLAEMGAEAH